MPFLSSLFDAPSRWTALDPLAARARETADRLLPGRPGLRVCCTAARPGHPLHPAMAMVPVGTSLSALLLDAAAVLLPGGDALGPPARGLAAASVATVAPTALAGWADYVDLHPDQQRTAIVHAGGQRAGRDAVDGVAVLPPPGPAAADRGNPGRRGAPAPWAATSPTGWAAGANHAEHLVHLAGDGQEFSDIGTAGRPARGPSGAAVDRGRPAVRAAPRRLASWRSPTPAPTSAPRCTTAR